MRGSLIDWFLANYNEMARGSRWMAACLGALVLISTLPRGPVDRVIAIVGLVLVGTVFALWLTTFVIFIVDPRWVERTRARRAAQRRASSEEQ